MHNKNYNTNFALKKVYTGLKKKIPDFMLGMKMLFFKVFAPKKVNLKKFRFLAMDF